MLRNFFLESKDRFEVHTKTHAIEKCRNQVRFQNGQVIDLAILKPGFELARPFQNQGRFQNGQVNNLAVSKRPMAVLKRPGFRNGREHLHLAYYWS